MSTSWSGRLPTSYTRTLYDAHILYDEPIRYDGLVIYDTNWTGRTLPYSGTVMPVLESGYWDDSKLWNDSLLWSDEAIYGTQWAGRPLI